MLVDLETLPRLYNGVETPGPGADWVESAVDRGFYRHEWRKEEMTSLTNYVKRFLTDEDGPTATEYAVMLALIIVVAVGAISGVGTKVDTTFTNLDNSLPTGAAS